MLDLLDKICKPMTVLQLRVSKEGNAELDTGAGTLRLDATEEGDRLDALRCVFPLILPQFKAVRPAVRVQMNVPADTNLSPPNPLIYGKPQKLLWRVRAS
jgi:hypothetical protein